MKFRFGAASERWINYYRMLGAIHIGEAVQPGDTWGAQNHVRDQRLMRYAGGNQHATGVPDVKQDPSAAT